MPQTDQRYEYRSTRPPGLSVERLDQMADFITADKTPGYTALIIGGIKLAVVVLYLWARREMQRSDSLVGKQEYEREQAKKNQGGLDGDDQSSAPKVNP